MNKYCSVFKLLHNIPEISKGAILGANCEDERYVVLNLQEVARYELKPTSKYTFIREVVENKPYWFEEVNGRCCEYCDEVIEY